MSYLDSTGLQQVWNIIRKKYATNLTKSVSATSNTLKLSSADGTQLSSFTLDAANSTNAGLMTKAMYDKLNGIASGANAYTLPTASASTLGGIKVGTNLSIDGSGVLSAVDTKYSLPTASASTLGGIKVGTNLSIDSNGVLSATDTKYTLPTASATVLGGIKVGNNLSISNGVLSATDTKYSLPTASSSTLGGVKVGSTLAIANGVLNLNSNYTTARQSQLWVGGLERSGSTGAIQYVSLNTMNFSLSPYGLISIDAMSNSVTLKPFNGGEDASTVLYTVPAYIEDETVDYDGECYLNSEGKWAGLNLKGAAHYDIHTSLSDAVAEQNFLPTGKAVADYVKTKISTAISGAATYKGGFTANTITDSTAQASYALYGTSTGYTARVAFTVGQYCVCTSASTASGKVFEAGDMLFCKKAVGAGTAIATADLSKYFDAVQTNIAAMTTSEITAICV